jgi:plasmid stabilization system protein ParE
VKVLFSPRARDYVRQEATYLTDRNRAAAERFRHDINQFVKALSQFPAMGPEAADLPFPGARRFVVGDYLIHYEIGEAAIVMLTIRHGRERPPEMPLDDDADFEAP